MAVARPANVDMVAVLVSTMTGAVETEVIPYVDAPGADARTPP